MQGLDIGSQQGSQYGMDSMPDMGPNQPGGQMNYQPNMPGQDGSQAMPWFDTDL